MLNPEAASYLALMKERALPDIVEAGVAIGRAQNYLELDIAGEVNPGAEIAITYFPSPTADLPIHIYRPKQSEPAKKLPAMVFFHGGGWVVNFAKKYDGPLSDLAVKANVVIINLNYQKAPEHKFPIPFDDCYAALAWLIANQDSLNIDSTKIGVGGDSAGGNLAAAVALAARDRKLIDLAFQILIYPCNDPKYVESAGVENAIGYGLTQSRMKWFWDQYLTSSAENNKYAMPHRENDFANLPPTFLATAEYDVLRQDGLDYGEKLKEAGNKIKAIDYPGMIHGFFSLGKYLSDAKTIRNDITTWLKDVL
jgi:acetyl esterase